ncbi:sphingomyelin phosphodiesterase 1-like isoform X2 [Eurosta solidaginis]|uniref:sphingomyelin phosphodiesterase 1-like isoform X2 n=1 Tax=Eurosta solidaginis TaxID=178769 RepID=UPI003531545B
MPDDVSREFAKVFYDYLTTGIESAELRRISNELASLRSQKDIFTKDIDELSSADQFVVCTTCRATVSVVTKMFRDPNGELNGPSAKEKTKKVALDVCDRVLLETEEVCLGLFELNWPIFEFIVQNSVADARSICSILPINFCKVKQEQFNFKLNIDKSGSPVVSSKSGIPSKSSEDFKILQLTDVHYDPEYEPGSLAECPEQMCCQRSSTTGSIDPSKQAGYWGDYRNCDLPLHTIENAFDHIKDTHTDIEYIYQTGDIVPHIKWATTKNGNVEMLTKINNLIAQKFGDIPVYPSIGNHEAHPSNAFSPENAPNEININWLYDHLWSLWSRWLPADAKKTILKGGYYTALPKPGFRVISLNNNDCFIANWWIYYNGSIVIEQLQWLHNTLLSSEKAGEYVHILAHIPSGVSDCWTIWAREYNRIIERFSATISGIFNGHTHMDELNVHYTSEGHAVAVSWNGGSLTTFSNRNPNYVIYEVEPKSLQVVDYETWIFHLDKANALGKMKKPEWFKEYSFTEFTNDLSPAGLDTLLNKFSENVELLRKYWQFRSASAKPLLDWGCNNECLSKALCRMAITNFDQKARCQQLREQFLANLPIATTFAPSTSVPITIVPTTNSPTTTVPEPTEKPSTDTATAAKTVHYTAVAFLLLLARFLA